MNIRVLSYNIHKGFTTTNSKWVLREIRDSIRETRADLVLLQEVLGTHELHEQNIEDWPKESQFEFLADQVWSHFAYGKNAAYSEGHHGNAILSRFPIVESENINISTNRLESRGLLHAVCHIPDIGINFHVGCVHLDLFERGRRLQLERIVDHLLRATPSDCPLILGGDFNDWARNASRALNDRLKTAEAFFSSTGKYARTFPSWFPTLRLDRLYLRGFAPTRCQVLRHEPWNALSDHAPLLVDLELC